MIIHYQYAKKPGVNMESEDMDVIGCELTDCNMSKLKQIHSIAVHTTNGFTYYIDSLEHPFYTDRTDPCKVSFSGKEYAVATESDLLQCYEDLHEQIHNEEIEKVLATV